MITVKHMKDNCISTNNKRRKLKEKKENHVDSPKSKATLAPMTQNCVNRLDNYLETH